MHIVDGALATPVLVAGAVATAGGLAIGLRQLTTERIPTAGVLSAGFFVASLIHVPIGISSVHLIMNGIAGLILGWAAFPALFVGLLLQAVTFGFGGITVLGVNAVNIALPAVLAGIAVRPFIRRGGRKNALLWGAVCGALAIAMTTIMVAMSLAMSGEEFNEAAYLVFVSHIPVMIIEGALSAAAAWMIVQVKPELFGISQRNEV